MQPAPRDQTKKAFEKLQCQTQQDWCNREYIELITGSIKRISDFLTSFDTSCRSRLSNLNQKLTAIERKVDYLENKVSRGGDDNAGLEGNAVASALLTTGDAPLGNAHIHETQA